MHDWDHLYTTHSGEPIWKQKLKIHEVYSLKMSNALCVLHKVLSNAWVHAWPLPWLIYLLSKEIVKLVLLSMFNGSQLAKMKTYIPYMSLPYNLQVRSSWSKKFQLILLKLWFVWICEIWDNFLKIWYFVNCFIKVWIWKSFCTYVTHIISGRLYRGHVSNSLGYQLIWCSMIHWAFWHLFYWNRPKNETVPP